MWSTLNWADEVRELQSLGFGMWSADRLNMLELPGLTLCSGGLLLSLLAGQPGDALLSVAVVCILSANGLRWLTLHHLLGPLTLCSIQMVERDLLQWLVLLVAGVLVPFSAASYLLYDRVYVPRHCPGRPCL